MKCKPFRDQRGFGHLGLIIVVLVMVAVGGAGWFVYQKQHKDGYRTATDQAIQDALKNAKCDYDDKDLCKFFTSFKTQNYYTVRSTSKTDGNTTSMLLQSDGADKHYIKVDGATPYEVITIGNDSYTKAKNGTWWKQTAKNDTATQYEENAKVDLQEPSSDAAATDQTTYKKLGKEKCGEATCFKYQAVDPDNPGTTTYLWFDDKEYQLRRMQTSSDGNTFDATYSYEKITINVPSPVKDLGANQYLVPGQDEPVTLPATGDGAPTPEELQQLYDQYQNQN